MQKVDHATVKALERTAPSASLLDSASLYDQIQKGGVFGAFCERDRKAMWITLQSIDGLIPSLFTFFEDFKYLQVCASCVKKLIDLSSKETVFTALERILSETGRQRNECIIQKTESVFQVRSGDLVDRTDLIVRQIFLYTMRHHREMLPGSTMIEVNGIRAIQEPDRLSWYRFAALAERLGLKSTNVAKLMSIYSGVDEVRHELSKPSYVTTGPGEAPVRRCGRPYDLAYELSHDLLFLDNMHSVDKARSHGITPFFVRRSVYLAFFGKPASMGIAGESTELNPSAGGKDLPSIQTLKNTGQERGNKGQENEYANPTLEDIDQEQGQIQDAGTTPDDVIPIKNSPHDQESLFVENSKEPAHESFTRERNNFRTCKDADPADESTTPYPLAEEQDLSLTQEKDDLQQEQGSSSPDGSITLMHPSSSQQSLFAEDVKKPVPYNNHNNHHGWSSVLPSILSSSHYPTDEEILVGIITTR